MPSLSTVSSVQDTACRLTTRRSSGAAANGTKGAMIDKQTNALAPFCDQL